MAKMYRIKGPDGTFQGTLQEFRVKYLDPTAGSTTDENILNLCMEIGLEIQEYHTIDPVEPEKNPHNFHITGYSNVTAMHPVGSYIGWSRGPTVFATPMIYLSEANDKIDEMQEQIDDAADRTVYQMFSDLVAEARETGPRGDEDSSKMLWSCSIPRHQWFGKGGKYLHLTDEFISNLSFDECRLQMSLFIADCYRQR